MELLVSFVALRVEVVMEGHSRSAKCYFFGEYVVIP